MRVFTRRALLLGRAEGDDDISLCPWLEESQKSPARKEQKLGRLSSWKTILKGGSSWELQ
jgi:hypothetical protein